MGIISSRKIAKMREVNTIVKALAEVLEPIFQKSTWQNIDHGIYYIIRSIYADCAIIFKWEKSSC